MNIEIHAYMQLFDLSFACGNESPVSRQSHIFLNGGVVLKAKRHSSSKVWKDVDGKKRKKNAW